MRVRKCGIVLLDMHLHCSDDVLGGSTIRPSTLSVLEQPRSTSEELALLTIAELHTD